MRLFLLLDETCGTRAQAAIDTCRARFSKQPWIVCADVTPQLPDVPAASVDERAQLIAQRLQADDCAAGYVLEDYPRSLEELHALDAQLKAIDARAVLPLAVYWSGKARTDEREAVKAFRKDIFPVSEYMYEQRRMVAVTALKKLKSGFKEARQRSKKVQIIRRGTSIGVAVGLGVTATVVLFFRDPILQMYIQGQAEDALGARCDIASFSTSLSDVGIKIHGVAAADAERPMRNVFEWKTLETAWDIGALSAGQLHAQTLALTDLRFDTERTESGALPDESPVSATAVDAAPAADPEPSQADAFVAAMNNSFGNFVPPDVETLASHALMLSIQADAEKRHAQITTRSEQLDVATSLQKSQQAAAALDVSGALQADATHRADALQAHIDGNTAKMKAVQARSEKELATVQASLTALESCQISGPEDIVRAKQLIEDTKKIKQSTDAIRADGEQMKALVADSRAQVQAASAQMKQQGVDARNTVSTQFKEVRAPLDGVRADVTALKADSTALIASLAAGKDAVRAALAEDIETLKQQYNMDTLKAGVESIVREMIGESVYDTIATGHDYYQTIKPWLPISGDTKKTTAVTVAAQGQNYDFSVPADTDPSTPAGSPALWIHNAEISGYTSLLNEAMSFTATVDNFTSNMLLTQQPVSVKLAAQALDGDNPQTVSADVTYACVVDVDADAVEAVEAVEGDDGVAQKTDNTDTAVLSGTAHIDGIVLKQQPVQVRGKLAGLAPQHLSCQQLSVTASDIYLGDSRRDALIEIDMRGVQLGVASGVDVSPELAAVFTESYAQIQNLRISIGTGNNKTFRTQPDISKLITDTLRQKVQAHVKGAQAQAQAHIEQAGIAQGASLDTLAADYGNIDALNAKEQELNAAFAQFTQNEQKAFADIQTQEASAQESLSAHDGSIHAQSQQSAQQQEQLTVVTDKIEAEKKRLQKKILGGAAESGLKKLFKKKW